MAFRKPNLESALVSAGELTLGEFGSADWDSDESPLVNMLKFGRGGAAIVTELRGSWEEEREAYGVKQRNGRAHENKVANFGFGVASWVFRTTARLV